MKHLFPVLALFAFASAALTGCKSDPTPDEPKVPEVQCTFGEVGINTIQFALTVDGAEQYAYLLTKSVSGAPPLAESIFADGETGTLKNGLNTIKIVDLDAATDYKVYVTTKSVAAGYGKVFASDKLTTKKYTDFVTMIDVEDYFSFKFHIEVPQGKKVIYTVVDRAVYTEFRGNGYIDYDFLLSGSVEPLSESKTILFEGWEDENSETGEIEETPVLPGQGLVVLACEVEWGMNPFGQEGWIPVFDLEKFINDNGGGGGDPEPMMFGSETRQNDAFPEDKYWLTDCHTRIFTHPRDPQILKDVHIEVEEVSRTTRSFMANLIPDDALVHYGYLFVTMDDWKLSVDWCGGEISALTYWSVMLNDGKGSSMMTVMPDFELQPDVEYRLILMGVGTPDRTVWSVDYYDFKAKEATQPAPKVTVAAIPSPSGEESPWEVWFNVKAPAKDVKVARFVCNSTSEVVKMLKSYSYEQLTKKGYEFIGDALAAINSDKGLDMKFDSWEDTDTRLVVMGFNEEETAAVPDNNGNCWADNHSVAIQPEAPVSSSLFADLQGDWTASAYLNRAATTEAGTVWKLDEKPTTVKVTITSGSPEYPSSCPPEAYKAYPKLSKEEVDALYDDFVQSATKYNNKIKGQNQLVCQGLNYGSFTTSTYYSPWSLFLNTYYSAYSMDDLFYDYGPKWHLQIADGDQVTLPVNPKRVAPMSGYNMSQKTTYLIGATTEAIDDSYESFNVKVSDDKNTIEILPIERNGKQINPVIVSFNADGSAAIYGGIINKLTLTKGWSGSKSATQPAPRSTMTLPVWNHSAIPTAIFHKTRLNASEMHAVDASQIVKMKLTKLGDKKRGPKLRK